MIANRTPLVEPSTSTTSSSYSPSSSSRRTLVSKSDVSARGQLATRTRRSSPSLPSSSIRPLLIFYALWLATANGVEAKVEISVDERDYYLPKQTRNDTFDSEPAYFYRDRPSARVARSQPYKSAASHTDGGDPDHFEEFSLSCPHVADAINDNVKIEVTWTLNETVWLKIEDGQKRIYNKLTTFNRRKVGGKTVIRVRLNNGRYLFNYDELTGDFSMEIRPVLTSEDAGVWQCHVTVFQQGNTHTLTSRSRVRVPHAIRHHHHQHQQQQEEEDGETNGYAVPRKEYRRREQEPRAAPLAPSFTRPEQEFVQISRDSNKPRQTVVFDRSRGESSGSSSSASMPVVVDDAGGMPVNRHQHHYNHHNSHHRRRQYQSDAEVVGARSDGSFSRPVPPNPSSSDNLHALAAIDYEMSLADDTQQLSGAEAYQRARARSAAYSYFGLNGEPDSALKLTSQLCSIISLSLLLLLHHV